MSSRNFVLKKDSKRPSTSIKPFHTHTKLNKSNVPIKIVRIKPRVRPGTARTARCRHKKKQPKYASLL